MAWISYEVDVLVKEGGAFLRYWSRHLCIYMFSFDRVFINFAGPWSTVDSILNANQGVGRAITATPDVLHGPVSGKYIDESRGCIPGPGCQAPHRKGGEHQLSEFQFLRPQSQPLSRQPRSKKPLPHSRASSIWTVEFPLREG